MSISRYALYAGAFKDDDGGWVKHEDHVSEIKRLRKMLTEVRAQCKDNGYWRLKCSDRIDRELTKRG